MKRWSSHGMSESREYASWKAMLRRCNNKQDRQYPAWGGRGIRVCAQWNDFPVFFADMGPRPEGMTLEREDNSGNYEPGNCRWATAAEQVRNRKNTIVVVMDGFPACLKDWCTSLEINYQTAYMRIQRGMTPLEALITPVQVRKS